MGSQLNSSTKRINMKTMLVVMLAIFAMAAAEDMTAEEQTLLSYGAYPYGYGVGAYGASPYAVRAAYPYAAAAASPYAVRAAYPYAVPAAYPHHFPANYAFRSVVAAPYNYNFLDTTKEPSAYLPGAYPYGYNYAASAAAVVEDAE